MLNQLQILLAVATPEDKEVVSDYMDKKGYYKEAMEMLSRVHQLDD